MRGKIILFAIIFTLIFSWGEDTLAQPINLGIKGGINFAKSARDVAPKPDDISPRTVFGFGGILEIGISDPIYLQVEPRYIEKGAKWKFTFWFFEVFEVISNVKLAYFEIPISVKAKFNAGNIQPYLFAGPTLSFLSSAKVDYESQSQKGTEDIKDDTEPREYSIDFGAGIAYEIAPKAFITGDIRYTLGLSRINNKSTIEVGGLTITLRDVKSRDIKILIGLLFSL